jgi:signal peptidase II
MAFLILTVVSFHVSKEVFLKRLETVMKKFGLRNRIILLVVVAVSVIVLDQLTKIWATDNLKGAPERSFLGGAVRLMYAENTGAWGSMGSDWSDAVKLVVMILLPVGVLGWITVRLIKDHKMEIPEGVAYAFIVSGGVGNIIDRIKDKYVVDFLWMGIGPLTTNVFNVADMAITGAMGLLIWESFWSHKKNKKLALPVQGKR